MTEHESVNYFAQDGQLQTWLERGYSLQESGEHLTSSLRNEFNLAIQPSKVLKGVFAEYCNEKKDSNSSYIYRLYTNKEAGPIDKNYLCLLASSGLLLGSLRDVPSVPIPFPQEASFKKLNEYERNQFFHTLKLTQELLRGGPPDEWNPNLHSLLAKKGERWMDASLIKGKRVIKILHEEPVQVILPELEKRLDEHLGAFSKTDF